MRSTSSIALVLLSMASLGIGACKTPGARAARHAGPDVAADPPESGNTDQAAAGATIYLAKCATCHGTDGKGTGVGPPVVGAGALPLNPPAKAQVRKTQFRTAKDVLDFIKTTMPKNKPGSLRAEDYAAILAFDLKANGIDLHGQRVTEESASGFVLHP